MSLNYKNATEQDIPVIAELADRIWKAHYVPFTGLKHVEYMLNLIYSPESIVKQMQEQQNYTLVYENETPIGYIAISTKDNKNYFLHKFYLEVNDQGKGIGSQVFEYILSKMKTVETIQLTVNRQNYKAVNFYFKHGFTIKEVADFDIGNGYVMNDFVMTATAKSLAKAGHRLPEL
jgi:ribosomal protein S18 acetylase RimI-like enzyme